ncbi:MAG: DUF1990 family protein [Bacteroidota bacterium]
MAEYRIGRGWSNRELESRLADLRFRSRNFSEPADELTTARGWHSYYSESTIARFADGAESEAAFERGKIAVAGYQFSDPRIVIGHFDPDASLLGRLMLLEMRALRFVHYLAGVVVGDVRSEEGTNSSVYGFRYDTLEGHIEAGVEWFLLTRIHPTGELRFRVEAAWRPGQFPNWWSRLGFRFLGPYYQRKWHRLAHQRLSDLVRYPVLHPPRPRRGRLAHTGPKVTFNRS